MRAGEKKGGGEVALEKSQEKEKKMRNKKRDLDQDQRPRMETRITTTNKKYK